MFDYIIVGERWKNSIIDCESDMYANVSSDHGPVKATARVKLKAMHKAKHKKNKYEKCTTERKFEVNDALKTHEAQTVDVETPTV